MLADAQAHERLERIRAWGLVDAFRTHHPEGGVYSWCDYRMLSFPNAPVIAHFAMD